MRKESIFHRLKSNVEKRFPFYVQIERDFDDEYMFFVTLYNVPDGEVYDIFQKLWKFLNKQDKGKYCFVPSIRSENTAKECYPEIMDKIKN